MTTNRSIPKRETSPVERFEPHGETGSQQWPSHEHEASPAQIQAQKLLEQAGSPELAKHAVDAAAGGGEGSPQDQFARELGFASYLSLFEDSSLILADADRQWFVTAIRNGEWVLWNDSDLKVAGTYQSRAAAEGAARRAAQSDK